MFLVQISIGSIQGDSLNIAKIQFKSYKQEFLTDKVLVKSTLQKALLEWAEYTETGKAAVEIYQETFDVGDLSLYLDQKPLQDILTKHGMINLQITPSYANLDDNWLFTDNLLHSILVQNDGLVD